MKEGKFSSGIAKPKKIVCKKFREISGLSVAYHVSHCLHLAKIACIPPKSPVLVATRRAFVTSCTTSSQPPIMQRTILVFLSALAACAALGNSFFFVSRTCFSSSTLVSVHLCSLIGWQFGFFVFFCLCSAPFGCWSSSCHRGQLYCRI